MVNTLFNKVLCENEKCVFYFSLRTEGNFFANSIDRYMVSTIFHHSLFMCTDVLEYSLAKPGPEHSLTAEWTKVALTF